MNRVLIRKWSNRSCTIYTIDSFCKAYTCIRSGCSESNVFTPTISQSDFKCLNKVAKEFLNHTFQWIQQRRIVLVVIFSIFSIIFFCFVAATSDLVYDVEAICHLPKQLTASRNLFWNMIDAHVTAICSFTGITHISEIAVFTGITHISEKISRCYKQIT